MIALDQIVTFARPVGFRIVRDLGTIRAEASAHRGILPSVWRMLGAFFGLAPLDILTDAERARSRCIGALRDRADALGATSVLGVAFEAVVRTDGATVVRATGTAVVLEPEAESQAG